MTTIGPVRSGAQVPFVVLFCVLLNTCWHRRDVCHEFRQDLCRESRCNPLHVICRFGHEPPWGHTILIQTLVQDVRGVGSGHITTTRFAPCGHCFFFNPEWKAKKLVTTHCKAHFALMKCCHGVTPQTSPHAFALEPPSHECPQQQFPWNGT
jgi:hypothetical protein